MSAGVTGIAGAIAAAIEQQGAATREISRNVQHAAQGTSQVAVNIVDVSKGAGESSTASTEMLTSARTLAGESSRLKREMEKFLATVLRRVTRDDFSSNRRTSRVQQSTDTHEQPHLPRPRRYHHRRAGGIMALHRIEACAELGGKACPAAVLRAAEPAAPEEEAALAAASMIVQPVYQWSRQTRSLHEPFQRRSTQRQRWATMIDAACGALTVGVVAVSVAPAGDAKVNATASVIAANVRRKVFLHPWVSR